MSKPRIVVYTAVFGKKDELVEPTVVPEGVDFVCFTDQKFSSRVWQVRRIEPPIPEDATRSARRIKILAHEYLPEYDISIWVDGNILVRADVREKAERELSDTPMAVYDHAMSREFPLRSLFEGAEYLIRTAREGKPQEDPALVAAQMEAYRKDGYPNTNGLLWSCVMFRRHHDPKVVETMQLWWKEVQTRTKRDQMSFNYVAWKTGLLFRYIPEDAADNPYFKRLNHRLSPKQLLLSYLLGAKKRFARLLG
jgi:hypothetical protein